MWHGTAVGRAAGKAAGTAAGKAACKAAGKAAAAEDQHSSDQDQAACRKELGAGSQSLELQDIKSESIIKLCFQVCSLSLTSC